MSVPLVMRAILVGSLSSFIGAGVSYFLYAQRMNLKRLEGIQDVMDRDAGALRETLFGETGDAANGEVLHNDDTSMTVLSFLPKRRK